MSGTPYIERGFSPETMNVPSFEEEEKRSTFEPKNDILSLLEQIARLGLARRIDNFIWKIGTAKEEPFQRPTDRQMKKRLLPSPQWGSASESDSQNKMSIGG